MRTKALLLGAKALPIKGSWVPIDEAKSWSCRVETFPPLSKRASREMIDLEVVLDSGETTFVPLDENGISGQAVRAIIKEALDGPKLVSIFLESL